MKTVSRKAFDNASESLIATARKQAAAIENRLTEFFDSKVALGQLSAEAAENFKSEMRQHTAAAIEKMRDNASQAADRLFSTQLPGER